MVSGAAMAVAHALPIAGINAAAERVTLHAWEHPTLAGGVLLAVEAAVSGVSILESAPRWARGAEKGPGGWLSYGLQQTAWPCSVMRDEITGEVVGRVLPLGKASRAAPASPHPPRARRGCAGRSRACWAR